MHAGIPALNSLNTCVFLVRLCGRSGDVAIWMASATERVAPPAALCITVALWHENTDRQRTHMPYAVFINVILKVPFYTIAYVCPALMCHIINIKPNPARKPHGFDVQQIAVVD